jgi:hypothetical protein
MAKSKKVKTKSKTKAAKPKVEKTVAAVSEPEVKVETKPEAKPEVKDEPKAKPKKAKKPEPVKVFSFEPPETKREPKAVDEGWRSYRLWTKYELDWDDKDDDAAKMKSIRKCMTKSKTALIEALAEMSKDDLLIQTDTKKDDHPFEPFIEVWIARKTEEKVREKLVKMELVSMMDPAYDLDEKEGE